MEGLTLQLEGEKIKQSFQDAFNNLLTTGNYNNPVKRVLDDLLGYSGSMKGELGEKIKSFMSNQLETPEFQAQLGKAIADEMARRAVDAMEKKK